MALMGGGRSFHALSTLVGPFAAGGRMPSLRFRPGTDLRISGAVYRIIERTSLGTQPGFVLKHLVSGEASLRSRAELNALYEEGNLQAHHQLGDLTEREREAAGRRRVQVLDDLPEKDADRRRERHRFLRLVQELLKTSGIGLRQRSSDGSQASALELALAQASKEVWPAKFADTSSSEEDAVPRKRVARNAKQAIVSRATYHRWLKLAPDPEDKRGLEGDFSGMGRYPRRHPMSMRITRQVIERELTVAKDKKGFGKKSGFTAFQIQIAIKQEMDAEILRRPDLAGSLKTPAIATVYRELEKFPAFDRTMAKHGYGHARRDFRSVTGHEHPTGAYEVVEYDETRLPFYFYDWELGIALGKGTFCAAVDVASGALGGFTVSFEPFSDLTTMATFRHAASLKSYVGTEYPAIHNPWLQGGMMQSIAVDNSKTAWGKTLKATAETMDCESIWLPARTPWWKPNVEGFFRLLNATLLKEMPGFDLGRDIDRHDYDPAENACIDLAQFSYYFHYWLLTMHHTRPIGTRGASPNDLWLQACRVSEPALLDQADDLDSMFGVLREGTLDHRGLRFMNIHYRSEELQHLRLALGAKRTVRFKINPMNLLNVRVYHPGERIWLRATANDPAYASGLTLYVHRLVQKRLRTTGRGGDQLNLQLARQELGEMIRDNIGLAAKSGFQSSIARGLGWGSVNLFGNLDRMGARIPPPQSTAIPSIRTGSASTVDVPARPSTGVRVGRALPAPTVQVTLDQPPAMAVVPPSPVRKLKVFQADDSLTFNRGNKT